MGRLLLVAVLPLVVAAWEKKPQRRRAAEVTALRSPLGAAVALPSSANCSWRVFNQTLDHFAVGAAPYTFGQRLCVYDGFVAAGAPPSMVWFYTGNESPVEEYVNNTGLMWETGASLNALLVWAEHRYEGDSVPDTALVRDCMSFATIEQALADYATIIDALRVEYGAGVPFVAVGGSYGGMLSGWLRMKYPTSVVGAVAGSAPIWGFPRTAPPLDGSAVAVTRGASEAGGLPDDQCAATFLATWPVLTDFGAHARPGADGTTALEAVADAFDLCEAPSSGEAVAALVASVQGIFFDLAEANYPFPSTYITSAVGPGLYPLPAWPMRAACASARKVNALKLSGDVAGVAFNVSAGPLAWRVDYDVVLASQPYTVDDARSAGVLDAFRAVKDAWATWCNVTGTKQCLSLDGCATGRRRLAAAPPKEASQGICAATSSYSAGSWGPVCCNDNLNLVNYLVQGTGRDFYWPPNVPKGATLEDLIGPEGATDAGCAPAGRGLFGYPPTSDPWALWLETYFGGKRGPADASNILFSNGLLDPWSAAGVYANDAPTKPGPYAGPLVQNISAANDVTALVIPLGAHHLDLMFMDDADPPCATFAREVEVAAVRRWISAA